MNVRIKKARRLHLTFADRMQIEKVYTKNCSLPESERLSLRNLAKELGLSHSTLWREIQRGLNASGAYSATEAQNKVNLGITHKGRPRLMTDALLEEITQMVNERHLTPENVRRIISRKPTTEWVPSLSTIYKHIVKNNYSSSRAQ